MNRTKGRKKGKHNVLSMEKGKSSIYIYSLDFLLLCEKKKRGVKIQPSPGKKTKILSGKSFYSPILL